MSHQIFNKKSYGFLLYFTFQGLHSLLLSAFIPYYIELLSILTTPIFLLFETAISEKQEAHKQIKKLKLENKQADIQAFLLSLHSKPPFPKQRFRKITSKKTVKL